MYYFPLNMCGGKGFFLKNISRLLTVTIALINFFFVRFLSMSQSIKTLNNLNPQDVEQLTVLGITLGSGEVGKEALY